MLQDRGELRKTVRWSGRTNDMRDNNVRDVIESYNDDNQFAQDIESALTRKDEFGRVMTPKEAFRQLCYKFHGIKASKNKQEKRIKKYLKEQKILEKNNTTK
jgi:U4/U6.U5 tri-snRNP-associated protein 1